jgi:hypothetical protein
MKILIFFVLSVFSSGDMFLFSLSSLLLSILTDGANVMFLTAVHCLPGGMDENKRNCMVRFSSLMDRDEVLQKEIALKSGSGYSVVPDLPPVR